MTIDSTSAPARPAPAVPGRDAKRIIETRDLGKKFGDEYAVRGVSFYVPQGSIFGFIGPSGAGKTTTIRMLTGFYRPSEGELEVMGRPPYRFNQRMRERIGYMPQLFVLYPHLSVWENLNFAASIYGMKLLRTKELQRVLDFVELSEHKNKLARDISGGMQRRLSLAATLVHNPDLLFLDEPTAGVDPVLRSKFWDHFRNLRDQGRTLFITTQYVGEAAYCDLVGVMGEGYLITVDTPEKLRKRAYGGDVVDLRPSQPLDYRLEHEIGQLPFVRGGLRRTGNNGGYRMVVDDAGTAVPELLEWMRQHNVAVDAVEEYQPPYDDVFVELIQREGKKNV